MQPHFKTGSKKYASRVMRSLAVVSLLFITACGTSKQPPATSSSATQSPESQSQPPAKQVSALRIQEGPQTRGFASSQACRTCHQEQFDSWHKTYHRTMTQKASPNSVVAPFDGRYLNKGEITSQVERIGDEFWVTTPDPDREYELTSRGRLNNLPLVSMVQRQVVMTTGSHRMQAYWVNSTLGNELRLFPWIYSIEYQRWMPFEDSFVVPPNGAKMRPCWNNSCIACHSVDGRPGLNTQKNHFVSEVVELGIACESCHGPAAAHIKFHNQNLADAKSGSDPIVQPKKRDSKISSQICGQCHSAFTFNPDYYTSGPRYRAGDELEKSRHMIGFAERAPADHVFHGSYWEDGTSRVGGREFLGLRASKCYQRGELSCLSCHSMHRADPDQLVVEEARDNRKCLECHPSFREKLEQHTHHAANSSGSECQNCHMPRTTYALFRAVRSHRIDSPSVGVSVDTGRPNACNLCHLDRSLVWTSKYLKEWYNTPEVTLHEPETTVAASAIWLLRGDAAQRVITAWHLGWKPALEASGSDWQAPLLAQLLEDSYSAIRFVASQSLMKLPGFTDFKFEFLESPEQLARFKESVIRQWMSTNRTAKTASAAFLQNDAGEFDQSAAAKLLEKQDSKPILISE